MNDKSKLKEIGLGVALSLLVATPAHSKRLPFSNKLNLSNLQTQKFI